jgi:tRNA1(Val) A37 N6-methylase TrmN6
MFSNIISIDTNKKLDNIISSQDQKNLYGEIFTNFFLINDMFDMLDPLIFQNKTLKWLDAGAGTGHFSIILYKKLFKGLNYIIPDDKSRHNHIIENMIYMCEIQNVNITILKNIFGGNANIINDNYINYNHDIKFDFIIGNPPYNCNGIKKVPTNLNKNKFNDGKTIWIDFVKTSLQILKDKGNLLLIIPSIWMKPDKAKIYNLLTSYKINKIKCFSNTETNKIFKKQAQTPTCIIYLTKQKTNDNKIQLFDKTYNKFVFYNFKFNEPIPVYGASIILKIKQFTYKYGSLQIIKTNLPSTKASISKTKTNKHKYINIKTCRLKNLTPEIVYEYSDIPLPYYDKLKIVLSHKMYGFPVIDREKKYGISNRDNYVFLSEDIHKLEKIKAFLSTKFALFLYEATRYRMKYLEKYIFQLIPDINNINDFPEKIDDDTIADFFNLTQEEIHAVHNLHKKNIILMLHWNK